MTNKNEDIIKLNKAKKDDFYTHVSNVEKKSNAHRKEFKDKVGYIYIYKCAVGSGSDVCKIGITKNFHTRLKQHVRTPYYGFMPYIEFTTGNPIATVFKVSKYNQADDLIDELFHENKFGNYEIYSIDYDNAIKKLYYGLKNKNQLIELIKEDYSSYEFLNDEIENKNTKITVFKKLMEQIIDKYGKELPEELLLMLRDKDDYIENCHSHYARKNYIDCPNNSVLDLNYNKEKRLEILNKLKKFI